MPTGRIHILAPSVADRIAAGEVVERPASVVKELVENSLDASATRILIEVERAGADLIRVSDNATGIAPDDLRLAVRRFATSKIASATDLEAIESFGFRGEALPSIAAVSVMEIASAVASGEAGRKLRLAGGKILGEESAGIPPGTVVAVRRLFFNTPARRKFLKSAAREFALIVDTVNRLALAHPAVAFALSHEGAEVLTYPPALETDRVAAVLGNDAFNRTLAFSGESGGLRIHGWLGRPELARASRRQQFLFVNRRPIHSRMLVSAIEQAFRQLLTVGRFPTAVIFLEIPAHRVDVNVHPRKLEVRFDDEHQIFGAIDRVVRTALRNAQLIRTLEAVPANAHDGGTVVAGALPLGPLPAVVAAVHSVEIAAAGRLPAMRLLGQLHATYLLAESTDGLIIIDQHAAHERVLYDRLLKQRTSGAADGQVQVSPAAVTLPADLLPLVAPHRDLLAQLGFELEAFGDRTVLIRAVPQVAAQVSPQQLLTDLLAELAEGPRASAAQLLLERLTITTACRTAIKAGDVLGQDQMAVLLRDLAQTADPFTCFHGRPTLVIFPLEHVERWFLRK